MNDDDRGRAGAEERPAPAPRAAAPSPLRLYKPGQGAWVRWCTAIGAGILSVACAQFIHEQLFFLSDLPRFLIPAAVLVGLAYLTYRVTGRNRGTVDFMIATEGEMKKVNWSTRREVIGATKVVIVVVVVLAALLFVVDAVCILFFSQIGVLKVDLLSRLLGGGQG